MNMKGGDKTHNIKLNKMKRFLDMKEYLRIRDFFSLRRHCCIFVLFQYLALNRTLVENIYIQSQ